MNDSDHASREEESPRLLLCFAVREETSGLPRMIREENSFKVLITGMGSHNARRTVEEALRRVRTQGVISCGFAGGLNPELPVGTVLFDGDADGGMAERLERAGARRGRFASSPRVLITREEKRALWRSSGADAVEMESAAIREVCAQHGLRCLTLRVISDGANEDLPLDFNECLSENSRPRPGRILMSLLRSPGRIGGLLRLHRQTRRAAARLGEVLEAALEWR